MHKPNVIFAGVEAAEQFDYRQASHPCLVQTCNGGTQMLDNEGTHFVVVHHGELTVVRPDGVATLRAGCFGTFPGEITLAGSAQYLVVSSLGYRGMALIGGPIEQHGRLRYVDNCTNTILLPPPVKGEPCLNFLRLPRHTAQTPHTHPSLRVGMVVSGVGICETQAGDLPMRSGTIFIIEPEAVHSFQSCDDDMRIVIYHPDSDSGPTHEDHTMLNRTFIDGVAARTLTHLHTKEGVSA